ncbi:MAG: nuclear transport factor 2 family protein [Pseudomonadota bacterium]
MNESNIQPRNKLAVPAEVRGAISDLMAEYGLLIDENRLEEWGELFVDDCDYRIVTRENVEQGLPGSMMWCDNRAMLRDRIQSYRHVNEYNLHWDRHVIGPVRYCEQNGNTWSIEASYLLAQTTLEGGTTLFSVGRYRCEIVVSGGDALFRKVTVIADTGLVPSLLATPL